MCPSGRSAPASSTSSLGGLTDKSRREPVRRGCNASSKVGGELVGVGDESGPIDSVWCGAISVSDTLCRSFEQRQRALGVAALNVRDADGQLSQTLPQHAFVVGAAFPGAFENLVSIEGEALIQQILRPGQRFSGCQIKIIGYALDSDASWRQRSAEFVAGTRVTRASVSVTIAFDAIRGAHVLMVPCGAAGRWELGATYAVLYIM